MMTEPPTHIRSISWLPGGAQNSDPDLICGDQYLVAVRACSPDRSREWWEFTVIEPTEDGFETEGGRSWDFGWSDVEWYVPLKTLQSLPVPGEEPQ